MFSVLNFIVPGLMRPRIFSNGKWESLYLWATSKHCTSLNIEMFRKSGAILHDSSCVAVKTLLRTIFTYWVTSVSFVVYLDLTPCKIVT